MHASNFTLNDYAQRIGYTGHFSANIDCITHLMRLQLRRIAFENLDVQQGKITDITPEAIVEKLLHQQRGGYCYEQNGLFAMVLQALNVPYQFLAAYPMTYPEDRPKTHMIIKFQLPSSELKNQELKNQEWLCDLGFGSYGMRSPINLGHCNELIEQDYDHFRLAKQDEQDYHLQALVDGEWQNQFGFNLYPHRFIDFTPANYMNSTHPDSLFVRQLIALIQHDEGRLILLGNRLKDIRRGISRIRQLSDDDVQQVLIEQFGLNPEHVQQNNELTLDLY